MEVESARGSFPQARHSPTARAITSATAVHIADVREDLELEEALRRIYRTVLSVPLIRDGRSLGAITLARRIVRPFSEQQIELLQTFADQAVIAIENVRLFKELEARNVDLTEALERQRRDLGDPTGDPPARRPTSSRSSTRSWRALRALSACDASAGCSWWRAAR